MLEIHENKVDYREKQKSDRDTDFLDVCTYLGAINSLMQTVSPLKPKTIK